MSDDPRTNDPELRARFAELRGDDARRAPAFESMWRPRARARKVVSAWWVAAPVVSFAAAAAFVVWIASPRAADRAAPAPVAHASAVAPTEPDVRVAMEPDPLGFLLEEPSLASLPDFDSEVRVAGAANDSTRRP